MLYQLDVEIDYAALGERRAELIAAEWDFIRPLIDEGVVVCEWRKASGTGVIAVWDCRDHGHLQALIAAVPLRPYLARITVTPLTEHPLFPGGRPPPRPPGGAP